MVKMEMFNKNIYKPYKCWITEFLNPIDEGIYGLITLSLNTQIYGCIILFLFLLY